MAGSVKKKDQQPPNKENIRVAVRLRPLNDSEDKRVVISLAEKSKKVNVTDYKATLHNAGAPPRQFGPFDCVYGPKSRQIDIYREIVAPRLSDVLNGYNCTIFAYGQTGTGKTFTMEGECSSGTEYTWYDDPKSGIIPRSLHQMFETLNQMGADFTVRVSYVELYNEILYDLLGSGEMADNKLSIYDDPVNQGSVVIKGVEEIVVRTQDEVYDILSRGSQKRQTAATLMNAQSSRSHSVFTVSVTIRDVLDGVEVFRHGKLYLVDLAGSENIGRSGANEKRAREAGNINQSLLTLGRVITALIENRSHVPYRESKLTRILQDSLGGKTMTTIIATLSPTHSNFENYASEMERLRRDLVAAREKNGITLAKENYEEMVFELRANADKITQLSEQLDGVQTDLLNKLNDIEVMDDQYAKAYDRLQATNRRLDRKEEKLRTVKQVLVDSHTNLRQEQFVNEQLLYHQQLLQEYTHQITDRLNVADADLRSVHSKTDRLGELIATNHDLVDGTCDRVQGYCDQCHRDVPPLKELVASCATECRKNNAHTLATQQSHSAHLAEELDEVSAILSTAVNQIVDDHLPVITDQQEKAIEDVRGKLEQHQTAQTNVLNELTNTHSTSIAGIQRSIDGTSESVDEVVKTTEQQQTERLEELNGLREHEGTAYETLHASVRTLDTTFASSMDVVAKLLSQLTTVRAEFAGLQEEQRRYMQQYDRKVVAYQQQMDDIHKQLTDVTARLGTSHTRDTVTVTGHIDAGHRQRTDWCDRRLTRETEMGQEMQPRFESVRSSMAETTQAITTCAESTRTAVQNITKVTTKNTSEVRADLQQHSERLKNNLTDTANRIRLLPAPVVGGLIDCDQLIEEHGKGVEEGIRMVEGSLSTMQINHDKLLTSLTGHVNNIHACTTELRADLGSYQTTGNTPKKCDHKMSCTQPIPPARDELIDEFSERLLEDGGAGGHPFHRLSLLNETLSTTAILDESMLMSPSTLKSKISENTENLGSADLMESIMHPKINDSVMQSAKPLRAMNGRTPSPHRRRAVSPMVLNAESEDA